MGRRMPEPRASGKYAITICLKLRRAYTLAVTAEMRQKGAIFGMDHDRNTNRSRYPFGRLRHAALAGVTRKLSETALALGIKAHDDARNRASGCGARVHTSNCRV